MWLCLGLRLPPGSSNCLKYALTPNHQRMHTSYLRGMVNRKYRRYIGWSQNKILWDAILLASQPALFATTSGKCEAPVLDKLYDHSYHAFVRQESEQLAGEATVSDTVINRCQIYKLGLAFFLLQNSS